MVEMSPVEPYLEPILRWMRIRRVLPHLISKQTNNIKLLDVGCGTSAAFLKSVSSKIKYGIGVDLKVEEFEVGNIRTVNLKLEEYLPFEDSSFQIVTMLAVLEHIKREKEILAEIYRVLAPGGKLIITVPSVWSQPILEFLAYNLKVVSEAEIRDHKRYYTREKLRQVLVDKTGFQEFHHRYFQFWMNNFCTVVKRS